MTCEYPNDEIATIPPVTAPADELAAAEEIVRDLSASGFESFVDRMMTGLSNTAGAVTSTAADALAFASSVPLWAFALGVLILLMGLGRSRRAVHSHTHIRTLNVRTRNRPQFKAKG